MYLYIYDESKAHIPERKPNSREEIESSTPPLMQAHLCDPRECVCHRIVGNVSRSKLKWIQVYESSYTLHITHFVCLLAASQDHSHTQ